MKKIYEAPKADVINLAAMESIALLQGRAAEDGDPIFAPSGTGTGKKDDF